MSRRIDPNAAPALAAIAIGYMLVPLALVACGGTGAIDTGDATDDVLIGVSLDASGDVVADALTEATADVVTDAIADAGIDAAALAACINTACSNAQAQCGPITAKCFGQPVDCGACSPSYEMCGDNGYANHCGFVCLDQFASQCQSCPNCGFNFQPTWGVSLGCTQPYRVGTDGGFVLRAGGISGCVSHQLSNNLFATCCP